MLSYKWKDDIILSSSVRIILELVGLDSQDPSHRSEDLSTSTFEINYVLVRLHETDSKYLVQITFWSSKFIHIMWRSML